MQHLRLNTGRGLGDLDRSGGADIDAGAREVIGGREAKGAVGNDTNADAHRFGVGGTGNLAILGGERAITLIDNARFGQ